MTPRRYRNLSGDSGVTRYLIGPDYIAVQFDGPAIYTYDSSRPGPSHVERMKTLAEAGQGLGTYINRFVRKAYASRRSEW